MNNKLKVITEVVSPHIHTLARRWRPLLHRSPLRWPRAEQFAGLGVLFMGAALLALHSPVAEHKRLAAAGIGEVQHRVVPLPDHAEPHEPVDESEATNTIQLVVQPGDSLSSLFARAGLQQRDLLHLLDVEAFRGHSRRLRPGQTLTFAIDQQGHLEELAYQVDGERTLRLRHTDGRYRLDEEVAEYEHRRRFASGTINHSLFLSGREAGLSDNLIMAMTGIFGWDIDFVLDIRQGDRFSVLYEELWRDGKKVRDGAILAAEFVSQGRTHRAVRFSDGNGATNYYTPDGRSMRKTFIRTPVEFTRISSRFGNRYHPTLNRMRRHNGVDYAAPTGTPIRATGDGRIVHSGPKGGYGETIIIRHGGQYSTLYAHMSRYARGMRAGRSVRQGQVIGYVGQTGLATGPHLHYEFRVNGAHRNPLTVNFPRNEPIAADQRDAFEAMANPLLAQLDLHQRTQLATRMPLGVGATP